MFEGPCFTFWTSERLQSYRVQSSRQRDSPTANTDPERLNSCYNPLNSKLGEMICDTSLKSELAINAADA